MIINILVAKYWLQICLGQWIYIICIITPIKVCGCTVLPEKNEGTHLKEIILPEPSATLGVTIVLISSLVGAK